MKTTRSRALFERAKKILPGGVNSPVRAFRSVGGTPRFLVKGRGPHAWDADGNRYIDLVGSWGPLILGHAPPAVVKAIAGAAARGSTFGAPTPAETELAEEIRRAVPSMQKLRLVSSGTEAVMSAVRVARGFTKRELVLKFDGGYHGHSDGFLSKGGSGLATLGIPASAGVPAAIAGLALTARYNDLASVEAYFRKHGRRIAAVVVEPVAGNMGVVVPCEGFLEGLRRLCDRWGSLLLFDEVITGFRVAYGGAQALLGVKPDLTTLGKIIGGGLPLASYGGRADIMSLVAPDGPVYQAGTLSGNPCAVAAGLALLRELRRLNPWAALEARGRRLAEGLLDAARRARVPITVNAVGSMMTAFFAPGLVTDWDSAAKSDTKRYSAFFHAMLQRGVMMAPSQFEAAFLSAAHSDAVVTQIIRAARAAMSALP
ncbi:MAG: glutamate-1-semialdehyde 2,1-aminomutase [Planctomycetes bacterium]|nr:glutamate-1-semialdehyde 2,1-aminomutase [Planctomycetota bacterium]